MRKIWIGFLENNKNPKMENSEISPYTTSPSWFIEQNLLNIYFLLSHRIKGLGWNLKDFWEADTWTTSLFYCNELDLIAEEEKELKKSEGDPTVENAEEVEELYKEMFVDES